MKAFLLSLAVLVAISVVAAVGLHFVQQSSQDTYSVRNNVRI